MRYLQDIFDIQDMELSKSLVSCLAHCRLERIEVCQQTKRWNITISSLEDIGISQQKEICEIFKGMFTHVSKMDICFNGNKSNKDVHLSGTADYASLKSHIFEALPVSRTLLERASFSLESNQLILKVEEKPGLELFKEKLIKEIQKYYLENYESNIKINIEILHGNNLGIDLEKELKSKIEQVSKPSVVQPSSSPIKSTEVSEHSSPMVLGKDIFNEIIPISQITEEDKNLTISGQIFNLEERALKTGRKLVTFDITDNTNSISVKVFSPDRGEFYLDKLKNGVSLIINGTVKFDTYSNELVMNPTNIKTFKPLEKSDNAPLKRVELHLHTKMSSMDGMSSLESYISRAAKWGHPAIAITDHGVVQSFPDAYELGKKHNIKIIYGVEAYLADDQTGDPDYLKKKSYHAILLVKNYQGLRNLYKLISLSHLEYYFRRPRIPKSILEQHREGLLIGSACEAGELITKYLQGCDVAELKKVIQFYDYLEIQPVGNNEFLVRNGTTTWDGMRKMNRELIELGLQMGKKTVATGDVHFLNKEDAIYREILMQGKGYEDAELQPPLFFRTTEEMLEEFNYLEESLARQVVIDNTLEITEQIENIKPIPDEFYPPKITGAEEQIIQMSQEKARDLYGHILPPTVEKRLKKELDSIINNGFAVLYLISHKLVKKSNEDGYLVGSRGSVGSSFVATLTGITEVNPLPPHYRCASCKYCEFIEDGSVGCGADLPEKECPDCQQPMIKDGHDIPFEVFLGFKGDKVPDIDLNFSGEYQGSIMKYTEELFGKDYVYRAGTIATVAEKTAYGFVQKFLEEKNRKARNAEINRLVKGCTGVKRTTGQHPGGLMIVPTDKDIYDFTPIQRPADDPKSETITTHFDYHAISSRLVKLDILGHDDPTVIKMLEDITGVNVKGIPLDEGKTLSLFSSTDALNVSKEEIRSKVGTYGIPEFGTRFVRQMLEDTKPNTFSELVRISGFSHGTDVWLNNAQDLIKQGTAKLSEAISTRDDIMVFLIYQGMEPVTAFKIMENVRKGKGVTLEQEEAMQQAKVPQWYIDSCKKIKYMFPKAHAVAYVMMAFRIAYFKVYYPEAFYASFFTVRADEFDAQLVCQGKETVLHKIIEIEGKGNEASQKEKNLLTILELALEMYCRGIKMLKVSLKDSHSYKFLITPEGLLPPLGSLQGVGKNAANSILEARNEKYFISIDDIRERSRVSKTVIEALEEHGCLAGLPASSQLELF